LLLLLPLSSPSSGGIAHEHCSCWVLTTEQRSWLNSKCRSVPLLLAAAAAAVGCWLLLLLPLSPQWVVPVLPIGIEIGMCLPGVLPLDKQQM